MINIFNNKKNVDNKEVILHAKNGRKIYARTLNQLKIVKEIELNDIVFSNGPAGTGKTYTAVAIAVNFLKNKSLSCEHSMLIENLRAETTKLHLKNS